MSGGMLSHEIRVPRPSFAGTGPQGHRQRMRDRLFAHGASALADYELLEMLLFLGIPRRDTKPLAKATINSFGGLAAVLSAGPERLRQRAGLDARCTAVLSLVQEAGRRLALADAVERPVLGSWDRLIGYLAPGQGTPRAPGCRVLFLDNRNRLLADDPIGPGDAAHLGPHFAREVVRMALERHATALIPVVTRVGEAVEADAPAMRRLKRAGAVLSIAVHDALILRGDGVTSLRREGAL